MMNDLKLIVRRLIKSPGFTVAAILTLALCIGANITIFSAVDAILVRGLPFPEADRLVRVHNSYPGLGADRSRASLPNYFNRREGIEAFASVSLHQESFSTVGEEGSTRRIDSARVTPEFFGTLGISLVAGRVFTEEEMDTESERVVIITDAFWRGEFQADPNVIGRTFSLNSAPATVVGVLPPDFRFLDSKALVYRPLTHGPAARSPNSIHNNIADMIARLAPGVALPEAQAEMDAFNVQQFGVDAFVVSKGGFHTKVVSLHSDHVRKVKPFLILLQIGVLFLFVIGAMNLMNLLFIRASSRFKELAVRQALGAGRRHQVRGVLMETVLLALGGGFFGVLLATLGIELIRSLGTEKLPLGATIEFDLRLALLSLLGSVITGVCLALPIIGFNNVYGALVSHLQSDSRTGTAIGGVQRLRSTFSMIQVALALVLLAGAGLLGISLKRVLDTSPGFEPAPLLTARISLPWRHYPDVQDRLTFINRLMPSLQGLPGVTHVAISNVLPFTRESGDGDIVMAPEGFVSSEERNFRSHYTAVVTSDYFAAMGIPLLDGRLLTDSDDNPEAPVALIDAALAEFWWPGANAVGRRFSRGSPFNEEGATTVVGVVGDAKRKDLVEVDGHGSVYFPYVSMPGLSFRVILRSSWEPQVLAPMVRQAVQEIDPGLPISELKTMQAHIDESLTVRRSPAILAAVFAGVALLLAAIGVYGVLGYAVGQRRREIGVRMALGALPGQIRNQFLGMGARLFVFGALLGLLGTWAAGRAMQSMLFGVPAFHWPSVVAAVGVIAFVTLVSCLLPSDRAARIGPTEALRHG